MQAFEHAEVVVAFRDGSTHEAWIFFYDKRGCTSEKLPLARNEHNFPNSPHERLAWDPIRSATSRLGQEGWELVSTTYDSMELTRFRGPFSG